MNFEFLLKVFTSLLIFSGFFFAGLLFKKIGYKLLLVWAKRTKWHADDALVPLLRNHLFFWLVLFGIYFSAAILLNRDALSRLYSVLLVCFLISVTLLFSKFVSVLISMYSERIKTTVAMSELTQGIARLVVLIIGFLMILNSLGISIAPLLTTLGIGGLAVALALQDTLSNFFAGFHILLAKQISIGDFVRIDSGIEGYITDITWRTTKIRMSNGNVVLVPNFKLSQSIIINCSRPAREMTTMVELSVHYASNLEEVEKITFAVAKAVMQETEEAASGFQPIINFCALGDSGIQLTVMLKAKEFNGQFRLKHEFIKRLHEVYKEKGIVIPCPVRALNFSQEGARDIFKTR
ncbi:MAG: mechanosensitive ion channel family protein [Candidatus Omnitrophota bacterium]